MKVTLKDPNRRIHGKLHKCDPFYFRFHYGEQHLIPITKPYIDRPTEQQKTSRQAFTALRKEVARQLHDPILKARWEARFKKDKEGYKMLHTYVYAKMKAGETVTVETRRWCVSDPITNVATNTTMNHETHHRRVFTPVSARGVGTNRKSERRNTITSLLVVYDHTIIPIFLPNNVPKLPFSSFATHRTCLNS